MSSMLSRKLLRFAIALAAFALCAPLCSCASRRNLTAADLIDAGQIKTVAPNYKLTAPEITDLTVTATANGYAVLPERKSLYSKEAGISAEILTSKNAFAAKGDVLARLFFDQDEVQTNIEKIDINMEKYLE